MQKHSLLCIVPRDISSGRNKEQVAFMINIRGCIGLSVNSIWNSIHNQLPLVISCSVFQVATGIVEVETVVFHLLHIEAHVPDLRL